ncbi:MAG: hypothetical protein MUC87_21030 [Bacteroidia bacterium]|jgi:hypothetical protein|nr:hypothetical protein [Bacteroidia bacterium]
MSDDRFPLRVGGPLESSALVEHLLPAAIAQLVRDFESAGCEAGFGQQQFSGIFEFRDVLAARLQHPAVSSHVPQVLYRVDVPEKYIKAALASALLPETALAELMIIRALQKVWLRQNYGKPPLS